ncbi:MAG: hypothetical protein FWD78_05540 [Treponema sp.]|nr:hypothetical protein [Treponema sp.]
MIIEQSYFDEIYNSLLNLNFAGIVNPLRKYAIADGNTVTITFGTPRDLTLYLDTPSAKSDERGTTNENLIIKELFDKVGLLELYN